MAEEGKGGVREGLRNSVGLLVAFKEAVQETLEEARDRGDFSTDKAKSLVQEAAQRVQHSVEEARERLDFVSRKEFDELKAELDALRQRVAGLESHGDGSVPEAGAEPSIQSASGARFSAGQAPGAEPSTEQAPGAQSSTGPGGGAESFPVD